MFSGKFETKILSWKDFRDSLTNWPNDITKVSKEWAKAPLSNIYLAYDHVELWPDAWMLISDGIYCDISVALGMFYTLYYSSYENKDSMKIECYKLTDRHEIVNLVNLEDGKYMLNWNVGEPVNILSLGALPQPMHTVFAKDLPIKR
jgi:hypothetical protein